MKPEGGPPTPGRREQGLGEGHALGSTVRSGGGAWLGCAGGPGAGVQRRGGSYKPGGAGAGLSQRSPTSRARRQDARRPNHRERHREGPAAAPARRPLPAGRARCARCATAPCCPRRASHQGCAAPRLHWLRGWDRSGSARSQGAGRGGAERPRGSVGSRGREGGSPPQPPPGSPPVTLVAPNPGSHFIVEHGQGHAVRARGRPALSTQASRLYDFLSPSFLVCKTRVIIPLPGLKAHLSNH